MLNPTGVTLADYIAAVKADKPSHVRLTFTGQSVVLTDDDIESSGITLNHFLNGDTDLTMGRAVMANITVPIIHTAKINDLIWSGEFQFEIGQVIDNNTTEWITVGYFAGTRPEKVDSVDVIEFTANDRMNRFERLADDWVASLTYPITVEGLFQSLCNYCGVGYVSGDELPNMFARSYSVSPFLMEGQTCRDILWQIAEACGCYAKITADGNCKLVWFEDHTGDYSLDAEDEFPPVEVFDHSDGKQWIELESLKWQDLENFQWNDFVSTESLFEINSLNIVDSIGGYNIKYPGGLNGNIYTIVDNPFLMIESDADKVAYIKPIFDRFTAFGGYIPLRVDAIGCALIEAGDIIEVDVNGETLNLPIFTKMSKWNGGITDEYQCTGQLNRADVSVETKAKLSEAGRYRLAMAQIELVAQGKYDIQSNINILPEGIEVTGGKYVKIGSGGTFDVESENFELSSADDYMLIRTDDGIFEISSVDHIGNTNGTRINPGSCFDVYIKYPRFGNWQTYLFQFKYFGKAEYVWESSHLSGASSNIACFDGVSQVGTVNKPVAYYLGQSIFGSSIIPWNNQAYQAGSDFLTVEASPYGKLGNSNHLWLDAYISEIHYYTLTSMSSRDVKHDIKPLPSVGEKLDKLKPVTFVYDKDTQEKQRMGLIYEDTVDEVPEICSNNEGSKSINYVDLIPMLLKEIQDLRLRVKELEEREGN